MRQCDVRKTGRTRFVPIVRRRFQEINDYFPEEKNTRLPSVTRRLPLSFALNCNSFQRIEQLILVSIAIAGPERNFIECKI